MHEPFSTARATMPADEQWSRLAFEASYEISSLAGVLRKLIDDANLDQLGKACCGMLVRIEQLGEAISTCVTDPADSDEAPTVGELQQMILGRGASRDVHP